MYSNRPYIPFTAQPAFLILLDFRRETAKGRKPTRGDDWSRRVPRCQLHFVRRGGGLTRERRTQDRLEGVGLAHKTQIAGVRTVRGVFAVIPQ